MISILGGTGSCGKSLIHTLLSSPANHKYQDINLVARRSQLDTLPDNPKNLKISEKIVNFEDICDNLETYQQNNNLNNPFLNSSKVFCCLGTTKKQAGSAEKFVRIDKDYVINCAKLAKAAGVEEFHYVSSNGANPNAFFLYTKTKGEIETELQNIEFEKLVIYRPTLLICQREDSRPGEFLAQKLLGSSFFHGNASIKTDDVAKGMLKYSLEENFDRVKILEAKAIYNLSKKF